MKPRTLKSIGRRMFGEDWQSPLARAIGRHRITIWRWMREDSIPDEDAEKIKSLHARTHKPWPV